MSQDRHLLPMLHFWNTTDPKIDTLIYWHVSMVRPWCFWTNNGNQQTAWEWIARFWLVVDRFSPKICGLPLKNQGSQISMRSSEWVQQKTAGSSGRDVTFASLHCNPTRTTGWIYLIAPHTDLHSTAQLLLNLVPKIVVVRWDGNWTVLLKICSLFFSWPFSCTSINDWWNPWIWLHKC